MAVEGKWKEYLQLCADVQDGLWEAASHAHEVALASLLQSGAVQWNSFADQLFRMLVQVDHTSPDAHWKADPHRAWMNPDQDLEELDDLSICEQCMQGLQSAKRKLQESAGLEQPFVRAIVQNQMKAAEGQVASIVAFVSDMERRRV